MIFNLTCKVVKITTVVSGNVEETNSRVQVKVKFQNKHFIMLFRWNFSFVN